MFFNGGIIFRLKLAWEKKTILKLQSKIELNYFSYLAHAIDKTFLLPIAQ